MEAKYNIYISCHTAASIILLGCVGLHEGVSSVLVVWKIECERSLGGA